LENWRLDLDEFDMLDKARKIKLAEKKQANRDLGSRFPMKKIKEVKVEKMRSFKDKDLGGIVVGEIFCPLSK
jgi:hypothetical protein